MQVFFLLFYVAKINNHFLATILRFFKIMVSVILYFLWVFEGNLPQQLIHFDISTLRQAQTFNKCLRVPQAPSGTMRRIIHILLTSASSVHRILHIHLTSTLRQAQCNASSVHRILHILLIPLISTFKN